MALGAPFGLESRGLSLKYRRDFTYRMTLVRWMVLHHDRLLYFCSRVPCRYTPHGMVPVAFISSLFQ